MAHKNRRLSLLQPRRVRLAPSRAGPTRLGQTRRALRLCSLTAAARWPGGQIARLRRAHQTTPSRRAATPSPRLAAAAPQSARRHRLRQWSLGLKLWACAGTSWLARAVEAKEPRSPRYDRTVPRHPVAPLFVFKTCMLAAAAWGYARCQLSGSLINQNTCADVSQPPLHPTHTQLTNKPSCTGQSLAAPTWPRSSRRASAGRS